MAEVIDEVLFEVSDLKKYYQLPMKKVVKAVDGVNFQVRKGTTFGIVGESGCGKTTVGRMIAGLTPATEGSVVLEGTDLLKLSKKEMHEQRRNVQFVFQDPYSSLNPKMKIGDIIGEPYVIYEGLKKKECISKVEELLELVGLPKEAVNKYPHEFSGGQRQRIGIARAIALHPQLVICDEPVSALDVSIQAQIINLLLELQKKFQLTYIFIAHGLNVVKYISDDIGVMYLGKFVEVAPSNSLFEKPHHPYTHALISAIPQSDYNIPLENNLLAGEVPSPVDLPAGCRFASRCIFAKDKCFETEPELKDIEQGRKVACHYPL